MRSLSSGLLAALAVAAGLAPPGCGTTVPLESYERLPVPEHPTTATFAAPFEAAWEAALRVLADGGVAVALADRQGGTIITGWAQGPSLVYRRRRLGAGEEKALPLPARYRLQVHLREEDGGTSVAVAAEEETNFLILTGVDLRAGREYYRDRWRPTPTYTAREHWFLEALGRLLAGPGPPGASAILAGSRRLEARRRGW